MRKFNKVMSLGLVSSGLWLMPALTEARMHAQVGFDVLGTNYSTTHFFGRNVYPRSPTTFDVFGRIYAGEHVFTEIGYESHATKHRIATVGSGESAPGLLPLGAGAFETYRAKFRIQDYSVSLGYTFDPFYSKMRFSMALGISTINLKARHGDFSSDQEAVYQLGEVQGFQRSFSKTKATPSIKLGVDYNLHCHYGVRVTAAWKRMVGFKLKSKEVPAGPAEIRFNDAYLVGIGAYYHF